MPIDLNQCTKDCSNCVLKYIKKHQLKKGDGFAIPCHGIPKEYIPHNVAAATGTDIKMAEAMFDPVTWAAQFLDWHCIDPDKEHWKRKSEDGTNPTGAPDYFKAQEQDEVPWETRPSIYQRPYQAEMLRCTSKRKVFRIGRQAGKTETLCIAILHRIFTNENFKVVIITPFQSQIDLIFKRINDMIESNPILLNSRKKSNKAPNYKIELHNGSEIRGFTAGTRSGQDAGSARGQSAHMLVFDEADYLSSGDIDAALAIITNFPDATVWMSSTPTGRRERFYKTCFNKQFREFHFPSHINPNWSKELDDLFRNSLTEDGYKHEILAEFGEQEEGVYQAKYVEAAQQEYSYKDMKPEKDWIYMLGCDWNDPKIGTTIAVVGYNPNQNKFYLVDKHVVQRGDRTQLSACEKIAELNRIWNCDHIYVDRGYGATQIEVLKEFGYRAMQKVGGKHPDGRLFHIVKGYDFGGTIEVRDLVTKQPVKKHAKPFLIENSVRRFEQHMFHYPKDDEDYTAQLLGYIVDRVTDTGRFVYKQQNEEAGDHFLDAVNLALVAFTLEESKFGKVKFDPNINFAPSLGSQDVQPGKITTFNEQAANKPARGRSDLGSRPGYSHHTPPDHPGKTTGETVKLWSWPGFMRDAPPPKRNSASPFIRRRGRKPQRTKF